MIKRMLMLLVVLTVLVSVGSASKISDDTEDNDCGTADNVKEEVTGITPDGKILMKRTIIHKEHPAKPNEPNGKLSTGSTCYRLMGLKWDTLPMSYKLNPSNSYVPEVDVETAVTTSAKTWDDATSRDLFSYIGQSTLSGANYGDGNIISFADLGTTNTIAVTSVWYYIGGKTILESDMQLNTYYTWGIGSYMDVQNIVTHELGHTFGLSDLYTNSCSSQTMYGYSYAGDVQKRTLDLGDISGLRKLYGP